MALELPELQQAFADHLVGAARDDLVALVKGDRIPARSRLSVYRHHVQHSLAAALATTFPTVQTLVGDEFFRRMARAFVGQSPPTQPVLSEYGAELVDFIASYEPARGLPYLADIARLDWALNHAFHEPFVDGLDQASLSAVEIDRLPAMSLSMAPATALIVSPYPLGRIWHVSQPGVETATVELDAGDARLLVLRRPDDAAFVELGLGEAAFMAALMEGTSIEAAAEAACRADDAFDLSTVFVRLLALNVFAALQQDSSCQRHNSGRIGICRFAAPHDK